VIAASLLNGAHALSAVQKVLPVHYWQDWTQLFASSGTAHLGTGIVVQIATIVVATCAAALVLLRRDPAA
jgi:ABC-2 type transport system permease protein